MKNEDKRDDLCTNAAGDAIDILGMYRFFYYTTNYESAFNRRGSKCYIVIPSKQKAQARRPALLLVSFYNL